MSLVFLITLKLSHMRVAQQGKLLFRMHGCQICQQGRVDCNSSSLGQFVQVPSAVRALLEVFHGFGVWDIWVFEIWPRLQVWVHVVFPHKLHTGLGFWMSSCLCEWQLLTVKSALLAADPAELRPKQLEEPRPSPGSP